MRSLINQLSQQRPLDWRIYVGFACWMIIAPVLVHFVMPKEPLRRLSDATGGVVSPTLLMAIPMFFLLWLALVYLGKLEARDLGYDRKKMLIGVVVTFAFWLLMQAIQCGLAIADSKSIAMHGSWSSGPGPTVGTLLGQLFGNAHFEEIVFRFVAITQLMHYWRKWNPSWLRLLAVILLTQLFFWVMHFPASMAMGIPPHALVDKTDIILRAGFMFTWAFLQTRNLWIAVGVHALANAPTPLFTEVINKHGLAHSMMFWCLVVHACFLAIRTIWKRRNPPVDY